MSKKEAKQAQRLVLLDAHAILHRAYHALPDFTSPSGEPTGALYGLAAMIIKIISELKPDYIAACYDLPGPTFRHEAYEEYKAGRAKADEALVSQMKRSRDVFAAFGIPIYEHPGFEADDMLGTIVEQQAPALTEGVLEIVIASGDMDTLQLVEKKSVQVYTLKKGINDTILYDEKAVKERFGFAPLLLPDYKGLRGDPSDNIIGIKGIGEKTATTLITTFGTIEQMYKKLKKGDEVFLEAGITPRIIGLLRDNEEEALFSKTLATIRRDAPITFVLPEATWREVFSSERFKELCRELGFRTLTERLDASIAPVSQGEAVEDAAAAEEIDPTELKKASIALWLLDSNLTNPGLEDILEFAGTRLFAEAREKVFTALTERKLEHLYRDIEAPIIPLLEAVERRGIVVDRTVLATLSEKYHAELTAVEARIYALAGTEFNVASSKQLSEVLFEKLGLPTKGLKKTAGGVVSTRESELEKLRDKHPVIEEIMRHREVAKLLSTYVDNLPEMLDGEGALHTTFVQSGTTTGRMSSVNPNLQNLPSRGEEGKEVRSAFRAREGFSFAAFDYSQIEFRILALLSGDTDLIRIFREGHDFHAAVASEVFKVPPEEVTKDMRRKAKVINFGIIYGMGITSLQKNLGGSREEAQKFYDTYFDEFPGVAAFIEKVKREAHEKGYTETLFGRRRYVPGLASRIPYIRAAAEREAFNAPIQGTATGDIIKLAIARVDERGKREGWGSNVFLLLQIHDELIYEVREGLIEKVTPIIKEVMETVITDHVPLVVDVSVGRTLGEV